MKKNIEWLKKEIGTEMIELEPNRKEKWSDVKYQTLRSVAQKLNQLDEPEVLSQEWVDNNSVNASHDGVTDEYVHVIDLENLLVPNISEMETVDITEEQIMDWLDDNDFFHHATAETVLATAVDKGELGYYGTKYSVVEKPVIPKYVADWIEEMKQDERPLYSVMSSLMNKTNHEWAVWKNANKDFSEIVAQAWLDGFMVGEEPLYYALVKGHELVSDEGDIACKYWNLRVPTGDVLPSNRYSRQGEFVVKMSKSEWNKLGINDSNADFVEVEE